MNLGSALSRCARLLTFPRIRALLSVGVVVGLGTVGTLAAWSATNTTTSGTFTTGRVDLWLNNVDATTTAPVALSVGPLLAGQTAARLLTVANRGNVQATFTANLTGPDVGGRALRVDVLVGGSVSGTTCTGGTPAVTGQAPLASPGTTIYTTPSPLAASTGVQNFCVRFLLPSNAANTLQGTTGTVLFTFNATAVANA